MKHSHSDYREGRASMYLLLILPAIQVVTFLVLTHVDNIGKVRA